LSKSGELGVSDAYDLIKKYCNWFYENLVRFPRNAMM
jgi:hypothetical protein